MDKFTFKRVFRTLTSERFLLMEKGAEIAALDCHFLEGGRVEATLVLTDGATRQNASIEELLTWADEVLFPEASRDTANLNFVVVDGRVLGHFSSKSE